MNVYQCWHVDVPQEFIEAPNSFAARQEFARRHHKQVSECMAAQARSSGKTDSMTAYREIRVGR